MRLRQIAGDKRCARCDKLKPLGEFFLSRKNDDGLTSWCRECLGEGWQIAIPG